MLEKYLNDNLATPPQLDINQCRFGKWLKTDGAKRYQAQPVYQKVDELHLQVHDLANELVALHINGENAHVLARLDELHALRDSLLQQLKELASD
jgi:hypothetical protein